MKGLHDKRSGSIVQVVEDVDIFPIAPELEWLDVPDDCEPYRWTVSEGVAIGPDPAEELAAAKRQQLDRANHGMTRMLRRGFVSSALGAPHRYDCEPHNVANLTTAVAVGGAREITCDAEDGTPRAPRVHAPQQLRQLLDDLNTHVDVLRFQLRDLRDQLDLADDLESVRAVTWPD